MMSDVALTPETPTEVKVKPVVKTRRTVKPESAENKTTDKKSSALKKLEPETAKLLTALREKVNRKEFGRKVRDSEIIHLALTLIESAHLDELKERTYTEQDRLKFTHIEYQKVHGKISLDQFIGKLMRGEVKPFVKD